MTSHPLRCALVAAAFACATTAFAADTKAASAPKGGTPQNHHCKLADGTMDMGKTKKACLADKGTWAKDAAASAAAPAASAAPKK